MKNGSFMRLFEEGRRLIPVQRNGKKPLVKDWPNFEATPEDIQKWVQQKLNAGLVCDSVVVLDADNRRAAEWVYRNIVKTPWINRTPRGFHFYTKQPEAKIGNKVNVFGGAGVTGVDVRGLNGYVLAEGSEINGKTYERVPGLTGELPEFNPNWILDNVCEVTRKEVRDAVSYISKIRAVSGNGGHASTFRAACILRDAGMAEFDAAEALLEWNARNCHPPWSAKELIHKLKDAYSKGA